MLAPVDSETLTPRGGEWYTSEYEHLWLTCTLTKEETKRAYGPDGAERNATAKAMEQLSEEPGAR